MEGAGEFWPFLPLIGGLAGLLCLYAAAHSGRRWRLVQNLPTCKTTGVFIGLVELKGTAETSRPLTSYLAEQGCVYYQWSIQEHWSRTVVETYTDKDGHVRTRTRHESGWTSVGEGGELTPFYLRDDCGSVLVRPEGAKLEPVTMFEETCDRSDPLYYGKGPGHAVSHSDHRRRFEETGIPLHAELYVVGQARERQDVVAPEIAEDSNAPMFLISTRTEQQVSSGFHAGQWVWGMIGTVMVVGSVVARDLGLNLDPAMRWPWYVLVGAGFGGAAAAGWVWLVYNSLVDLRNRMRQAWSQVEVQLKRRHDLMPNLVEAVKGFRDYEQVVQTELAEMHSQLAATPPGVEGPDYRALKPLLLALAERYPELKGNELFQKLHKNLVDTEQRIALARGYFNEIATHYNTRLEIVPERYVASLAGMQPQPLMQANEFERAPVSVELDPVEASAPSPAK